MSWNNILKSFLMLKIRWMEPKQMLNTEQKVWTLDYPYLFPKSLPRDFQDF